MTRTVFNAVRPPRRWQTFGLRSLLILVTVLCVALALLSYENSRCRRQWQCERNAIEALEKMTQVEESPSNNAMAVVPSLGYPRTGLRLNLPPPVRLTIERNAPNCATRFIPQKYRDRVTSVDFAVAVFDRAYPRGMDPAWLDCLGCFSQIKELRLQGADVGDEDMSKVCGLATVESLYIDETAVTDSGLELIAAMPKLTDLALINLRIDGSCLPLLSRCKSLKRLDISSWNVSEDALDEFRRVRPDVVVSWTAFSL